MASFIAALSLFILVIFNGCFTLPIANEQISSSTISSLNDDLTTGKAINLRSVLDDEIRVLPDIDKKDSKDEHMGFEVSTSVDDLSKEKDARVLRKVNELSTSEPITSTNGQSSNNKRHHDDLSFTTVEPITHVAQLKQRGFSNEVDNENDINNNKQETEVELTTNDMLLFTSTSSAVAPELYTSESSTLISTSTEKHIALPKHEPEPEPELEPKPKLELEPKPKPELGPKPKPKPEPELEPEHEEKSEQEQTTTYAKIQRKATPKSKVQLEDKSEEDSKESAVPTTVFIHETSDKILNIPNGFLILEENIDIVVTGLPNNISTSTIENKKEEKPLNQGKESLHTEEKKPNYWNGSSFGWSLPTLFSSIYVSTKSWKKIN